MLGRTVRDAVTELVLVLVGLEDDEGEGEAVVVLDTDLETVPVLEFTGLRDLTESVALGDKVTKGLLVIGVKLLMIDEL